MITRIYAWGLLLFKEIVIDQFSKTKFKFDNVKCKLPSLKSRFFKVVAKLFIFKFDTVSISSFINYL